MIAAHVQLLTSQTDHSDHDQEEINDDYSH